MVLQVGFVLATGMRFGIHDREWDVDAHVCFGGNRLGLYIQGFGQRHGRDRRLTAQADVCAKVEHMPLHCILTKPPGSHT